MIPKLFLWIDIASEAHSQEFGGISGCRTMVSDVLSQLTSPLDLEDKRTMTCSTWGSMRKNLEWTYTCEGTTEDLGRKSLI